MPSAEAAASLAQAARSPRRPRVFVSRDHTMEPLLDSLAADLRLQGVDVVRGPANVPGVVAPLPRDLLEAMLGDVDVAMFSSRWQCTGDMLKASPRLRAIVNPTIGLETVDLQAANDLGIIIGHGGAPEHIASMAEASVMLILNVMYGLRKTERAMAGWGSKPRSSGPPHANMLHGSTIGLVGLGRIGRAVMDRLQGFGVRMLAHSPRADPSAIPDNVRLVDLDTLMRESDVVGVFIAVRPDNRKLIDARAISLMKRSAYLVNVSRGDAIDEAALIEALRDERIAGAALDTFAVEPLPADSPLRSMDTVILTPHSVGHTRQSTDSVSRVALENILRVLRDDLPLCCKNPEIEARWRERLRNLPRAGA